MSPNTDHDASPSPDYHDGEQEDDQDVDEDMAELKYERGAKSSSESSPPAQADSDGQKKNAKDLSRPRRKKARRACFACQRAHLTCGDERPCLRCEKRGLAASCQDGVRKKAKYLNDVQPEALIPGAAANYQRTNGSQYPTSVTVPATSEYYTSTNSGFSLYNGSNQSNMPPPPPLSSNGSFTNQQSPTSPSFQSLTSHHSPPIPNIGSALQSSQNGAAPYQQSFSFDPQDPALFNFDISGLNFGNQYGAIEFSMLGQMAGGAADSPSNEGIIHPVPSYHGSISNASGFADGANQSLMFNQDPVIHSEWHARNNSSGSFAMTPMEHTTTRSDSVPHPAYAIGAGPGSMASASPVSTSQEYAPAFDGAPSSPALYVSDAQRNYYGKRQKDQKGTHYPVNQPGAFPGDNKYANMPLSALQSNANFGRKRTRDHSQVYNSVKTPYGYTEGFHSLLAYLDKWYSSDKRMRIAKAIASFRPTLISTYGSMSQDDLIHSEKGFQRLLCEYDDGFFEKYSTAAVILRRTGEVASVSKEFSMITGWTRDVLLGKAPNLNANKGSSGNTTGNSTRGAVNTPRLSTLEQENAKAANAKPRPVLITELMDHESVVHFWEDCARAAYIDTSIEVQRRCNLMKYRAKEGDAAEHDGSAAATASAAEHGLDFSAADERDGKHEHKPDAVIKSEADMQRLGSNSGTVDCMYTWKMKRDTFDAPSMFIVQFMPVFA